MDVFLSIIPIFAVMVLGHVLVRIGLPGDSFWAQADKLVYWVLIPLLLFNMNSKADFTGERTITFAIVLVTSYFSVAIIMYLACLLFRLPSPITGSVLQGALRHNAWIALAVCEGLFGRPGLEMATSAMTILALVTNVSIVPILIGLSPNHSGKSVGKRLLNDTVRNPIIIGIVAGLAANALTEGDIPGITSFTEIAGSAALPLMLMCVGASLSFSGARGKILPLVLSSVGKHLVFPSLVLVLAILFGLPGSDAMVLLVFGAISTASAGLNLARQLNGDVPLMSTIIATQTTILFITLPVTLVLAQALLTK